MHPTLGRDRQPLGERDTTVRGDTNEPWAGGDIVTKVVLYFSFQPVRDGYLVEVGVLAVEEECVGAPDLVQELPVHGQLINHVGLVELEPLVVPVLPAVVSEGSPEAILLT